MFISCCVRLGGSRICGAFVYLLSSGSNCMFIVRMAYKVPRIWGTLCKNGHRKLKISLDQEQNFFLIVCCCYHVAQQIEVRSYLCWSSSLQEISNIRPITLFLSVCIKPIYCSTLKPHWPIVSVVDDISLGLEVRIFVLLEGSHVLRPGNVCVCVWERERPLAPRILLVGGWDDRKQKDDEKPWV